MRLINQCLLWFFTFLFFTCQADCNGNSVGELKVYKTQSSRILKSPAKYPLTMPTDAAVGRGGRLYVVDGVNHRVVMFNNAGVYISSFGGYGKGVGRFNSPLGVSTGHDGTVYVADTGNRRVQLFAPQGKFLREIRVAGMGDDKPADIVDVCVDENKNLLYMSDNDNDNIRVYNTQSRKFLKSRGSSGKTRLMFRYPYFLSITPQGYLLVVEILNTRIQMLNSQGKFVSFIGTWGVDPGKLYRPKGVASLHDKVFVSDSYLNRVQVFNLKGRFQGILADKKGSPIKFVTPTGIAVDSESKILYVVELKPGHIRRINLE